MADIALDPYAGAETEEERQAIYQKLQKQYEQDVERASLLNQQVYEPLKKQWDHYREVELDLAAQFLKATMAISSGVFGVSFAFIDRLIPFQTAAAKPLLVASWGSFALALIMSVFCYIAGSFINGKYCDDILEEVEAKYAGRQFKTIRRWYYRRVTSLLAWLSFLSLSGGMVCLVSFVLMNL